MYKHYLYDASINTLNQHLCHACINGNFDIVEYCINQGADVNTLNGYPLFIAYWCRHTHIIEYLTLHGGQSYNPRTATYG